MESYQEFFRRVCGRGDPFPFQIRFYEDRSPARILSVPTGLGKTATVLVDWLLRRPTTRLVYCLPGRALTQQVTKVARELSQSCGQEIKILELMGASEDLDTKLGPDEPAILVGTQDILISRALNRGYARVASRWPIDFALLNNDATWVYDEVQLLGDALAASTQLDGLRDRFKTFGNVPSVWMSATLDLSWLNTPDFHRIPSIVRLEEDDLQVQQIRDRIHARKRLLQAEDCGTPARTAEFVRQRHRPGTLTLVIANTVGRAQEIWDELSKLKVEDPLLIHSRFRPGEREERAGALLNDQDSFKGIVVATQVVEAGLDIDADLMITDVAPWASLVQRFGRVNRRGRDIDAHIYWVANPLRSKGKPKSQDDLYWPYERVEVEKALALLEETNSAAPASLPQIPQPPPYKFVLRRSDLCDLFDTTPDLAGNHIDVSRFVRSGEETNVFVAWRKWEGDTPGPARLSDRELCPVARGEELKALIKKHGAWFWDFTGNGKWVPFTTDERLYPGMRILFHSATGGYTAQRGWSPHSAAPVKSVDPAVGEEDSADRDNRSFGVLQSLEEHTNEVVDELRALLKHLPAEWDVPREELELAARFHDWGKAHPIFQETLQDSDTPSETCLLAKQRRGAGRRRHRLPWFRHELASALAMLQEGMSDLAVYVVAAHHGKVRLNIRSMPGEKPLDCKLIARGISDGDRLFPASLGGDTAKAALALSLERAHMGAADNGSRAWSDRVLDLLAAHGPFRLAYLEMLLRISDERASEKAEKREGAK